MKLTIVAIALSLLLPKIQAQNKHALLVGISKYKYERWYPITTENNISYYKYVLEKANFKKKNIISLTNEKASSSEIIKKLQKLTKKASKGDNIFIALCGHGTRIEDTNNDEKDNDGFDEVFVSYDCPKEYSKTFTYISDDTLNYYLTKIRTKIGASGQVIFIAESCYSGGLERVTDFENEYYDSGTILISNYNPDIDYPDPKEQFEEFTKIKNKNIAPLIVFTACQPNELAQNRMISSLLGERMTGLFTDAFCKAFIKSIESKETWNYNKLYVEIQKIMKINCSHCQQTPYGKGDLQINLIQK